jgi:hypothetical protein
MINLRQRINAELTTLDFRGFEISAALRVALTYVMYQVATDYGDERAQAMKEQVIELIQTQPDCQACADAMIAAMRALPD